MSSHLNLPIEAFPPDRSLGVVDVGVIGACRSSAWRWLCQTLLTFSLGFGLLGGTAPALAGTVVPRNGATSVIPGEIILKLDHASSLPALLSKYGMMVLSQFGSRPIYRVAVDPGLGIRGTLVALELEPTVQVAEPNAVQSSPEARRTHPWAVGEPSAYMAQWAPEALHLANAHAISRGDGIQVAILDTGVDPNHPALAGRLIEGFDFVDLDTFPIEVGTPADLGYGHGTHVAGIVALVAPNAKIKPIRVLDAAGEGNTWVLAEALLYAVDPDRNPTTGDGAQVINLSLGTPRRARILDTIIRLVTCAAPDPVVDEVANDVTDVGYEGDRARCAMHGGAVVVAAAGNDGSDAIKEYPAAEGAYGLLAVTASTSLGTLADFANRGSWVHVAAPGEGITSSVPGSGFGTWSGTSMAAPMVTGVVALLRAYDRSLDPSAVADRLERTTGAMCGTAIRKVDAEAALTGFVPGPVVCQ